MDRNGNKSRGALNQRFFSGLNYRLFPPILGTLLSLLPAFLYGCGTAVEDTGILTAEPVTKVSLSYPAERMGNLDVFVFRDNAFQKLDCYQRFDNMDDWKGTVISSGGKRIISVLANSPYDKTYWASMNSREFFRDVHMNLEDETEENPILFGEVPVNTYSIQGVDTLNLQPLVSEIRLNSICCDFRGKAYDGERISDVRVYLTNVNAECRLADEENAPPIRIVNAGKPDEEEMAKFKNPRILMKSITGEIGENTVYPSISLWCFQSCHKDETPGTPYTRLVIEGKISGRTYYWPININRDTDNEPGVRRGTRYIYDIKITRKGTSSPDILVKTGDVTINHEIKKWNEKAEYEVKF